MRPKYNGIKFYSQDDLSVAWELEKAEPILSSFDATHVYEDINAVIELYNIQQLIETGVTLISWDDVQYEKHKNTSKSFNGIIGRFFSKINDSNFIGISNAVCFSYVDDFWELIERYKTYEKLSNEVFLEYLKLPDTALHIVLKRKKVVHKFDSVIAEFMRTYEHSAKILVAKFIRADEVSYIIPSNLKPTEYEQIFSNYIESEHVDTNTLKLISNAQNTAECPINDKLRLKASKRYEQKWQENREKRELIESEYGIAICLDYQDQAVKYEQTGLNSKITYDIKWLEDNLDFPTVLNNFIYVFELFDINFRYIPVSVKSDISAFEDAFSVKGKKDYYKGFHFAEKDMVSSLKIKMYYHFLRKNNIDLENVFKWFFEEYLQEEFNVNVFLLNPSSSASTYLEKIRNIASEQDGVLKQFRMYVQDREIDRELFEMSSGHIVIQDVPSMINDKYAYANSYNIQNEMFALFSDQSSLSYTERTDVKYDTLCKLLLNEKMKLEDFNNYQQEQLKWLVERECLKIEENGILSLVLPKVFLLKDLFEHDVICVYKCTELKSILKTMISNGDLMTESTLFSRPEADYLNYKLNRSEFSNGMDLRNKYIHSTNTQNEGHQLNDYIELLKIMILIIVKMNDEFCYINQPKEMNL